MLFEGLAVSAFPLTASKIGLMVITLERYFKIVHAIAHRKHYRNWMTKVGVALPWIAGASLLLIPSIGTTRIVNGQCLQAGVWPDKAMKFVSSFMFASYWVIMFRPCVSNAIHCMGQNIQEAHLLLGDHATRKHAKYS